MNKVRVGNTYRYNPVILDRVDPKVRIKEGTIVKVINLPGAPKANTMGHCYVEDENGQFLGMVCCNSLVKINVKKN